MVHSDEEFQLRDSPSQRTLEDHLINALICCSDRQWESNWPFRLSRIHACQRKKFFKRKYWITPNKSHNISLTFTFTSETRQPESNGKCGL